MAKFKQSTESPDWRTYTLRVPVSRSYFWEAPKGENLAFLRTAPVPPVCEALGKIKGIQSFYVREGYDLVIKKAAAWDWGELGDIETAIDAQDKSDWPEFSPEVFTDVPQIEEEEVEAE